MPMIQIIDFVDNAKLVRIFKLNILIVNYKFNRMY